MRRILFLLIPVLFSYGTNASSYTHWDGTYFRFDSRDGGDNVINFESDGQRLFITFVEGWAAGVNDSTVLMNCRSSDICNARVIAYGRTCNLSFEYLRSGNLIYTDSCDGRLFTYSPRSGNSNERWGFSTEIDDNGVLSAIASVKNIEDEMTLQMSCKAPSDSISMKLQVNNILWRAAAYSASIGEDLKVKITIGSSIFDLPDWSIEQGNLLANMNPLATDEIFQLKEGQTVKVDLKSINVDGNSVELASTTFSLKNSKRALSSISSLCLNGSSDALELRLLD